MAVKRVVSVSLLVIEVYPCVGRCFKDSYLPGRDSCAEPTPAASMSVALEIRIMQFKGRVCNLNTLVHV